MSFIASPLTNGTELWWPSCSAGQILPMVLSANLIKVNQTRWQDHAYSSPSTLNCSTNTGASLAAYSSDMCALSNRTGVAPTNAGQ